MVMWMSRVERKKIEKKSKKPNTARKGAIKNGKQSRTFGTT